MFYSFIYYISKNMDRETKKRSQNQDLKLLKVLLPKTL